MAEFADSAVGNEGQDTATDFQVEATEGGFVSLPDGFSLSDATFETDGSDLLLTSGDGAQVTVEDFFAQDTPPELVSADGAQISGDMATQLAGGPGDDVSAGTDSDAPGGDGMLASNPSVISGTDGEPIGNIENLSGSVFAVRTDGTRVELKEGDSVFQGDILESGADGAVGILLADETTFSMGENGRIVLDEMVYDPATQEGSVGLSIVQGVFTFVSGQVAKTDPDAMTLDTPVATIGIRGTQVGIDVDPQGGGMNVVLMEEADGFVGEVVIANDGGIQVMNGANQSTSVANFSTAPTEIRVMNIRELVESFGSALKQLPRVHGNQNDFGTQEDGEGEEGSEGEGEEEEDEDALDEEVEELEDGEPTAEELAELETEAGEEEGEGEEEDEGDDGEAEAEAEAEAAQAAAEAAARAAEEAARRAAQAAAQAAAEAAADKAEESAQDAQDLSNLAKGLSDDALDTDKLTQLLGQFATGANAELLSLFQRADAIFGAWDDANTAAGLAADAAEDAATAAAGATGNNAFAGQAAAEFAAAEAEFQRLQAEAAAEDAQDLTTGDDNTPSFDDLVRAALQAVADSDWTGGEGDDIMDVTSLGEGFIDNVADQVMRGGGGDDYINAGAGNDVLLGGTGDDTLVGGAGADELRGGEGDEVNGDTADYSGDVTGVVVNLESGLGFGGDAEGDTLFDIENVTGGSGNDTLTGDSGDNVLIGGAGDDTIIGGGGEGTDTTVIDGDFGSYTIDHSLDANGVYQTTVTLKDTDGATIETDTISGVEIIQFADDIVGVVESGVKEDNDLVLDIAGSLGDTTGADSILITGVPSGAQLKDADGNILTANNDGSYSLSPALVAAGLAVALEPDSNEDFSLTLSERDANNNEIGLGFIDVDVTGVADPAELILNPSGGTAGETSIPLEINASVTDTDGSESLSISIAGVPAGATLSAGTVDPITGVWTIEDILDADGNIVTSVADQLNGLTMDSVDGFNQSLALTVTATTTEDDGDINADSFGTINITIQSDGGADAPRLDLNSGVEGDQDTGTATGDEDTAIKLDISAELTDDTEELSIKIGTKDKDAEGNPISGAIPAGSVLYILNPGGQPVILSIIDGEATIPAGLLEEGGEVFIIPPDDSNEDFDLTVTAISTVTATGETAETTGTISVDVVGVADDPTLDFSLGTPDALGDDAPAEPPLPDPEDITPVGEGGEGHIDGTVGDDILVGGDGNDHIDGHDGNDQLFGGAGDDHLDGQLGDDILVGGTGNDHLDGHSGDDQLFGGEGNDTLHMHKGDDIGVGGAGDDRLDGGEGADQLFGGSGNDHLDGGSGNDMLSGGTGDDRLHAGSGDDVLVGGRGDDELRGGSGIDTAVFSGPRDQHLITLGDHGSYIIQDLYQFRDGIDSVRQVEFFQFTNPDGTIETVSKSDLMETNPTDPQFIYALDISSELTDQDGSETLSIDIGPLPTGVSISPGTEDPPGSNIWSVPTGQLADVEMFIPIDVPRDFNVTVTATSTENDGDTAVVTSTLNISGADMPTLVVSDAAGGEDSDIPLDINASLVDTDGSETLSITISGVPANAVLKAAGVALVANADGTYTLTPNQLTGLTVTPPTDSDEDFELTVKATSDEAGDGSASMSASILVDVSGVADAPTLDLDPAASGDQLSVAVSGAEDTAIALNISAGLTDADSETLSLVIGNVPPGSVLSAGVEGPAGTWTLDPAAGDLTNLTITPPADFSGTFALTVAAISSEDGTSSTTSGSINVTVTGIADAPSLDLDSTTEGDQLVGSASGTEDTAIALDISAALTDGSETLGVTITISGFPPGATLSAGTDNGDGTFTFEDITNSDGTITSVADQLAGLTVTPPADSDADFTLSVTATSTDGTDTAVTSGVINVSVAPDADAPTLDLNAGLAGDQTTATATGVEDGAPIALDISSAVTDASETLSITITGVPLGATLSAGTEGPAGTWTLDPAAGDLDNLTLTPPADYSGTATLSVTATSTDGTDTAVTTGTIDLTVTGVADAPTLDLNAGLAGDQSTATATGVEDGAPIALDISAAITDASESLGISISGVPAGATLSKGTFTTNPDGTTTWTIDPADLAGLTMTPAADYSGTATLQVAVVSADGDSTATTTGTIDVTVDAVADAPTLDLDSGTDGDQLAGSASGDEDTAIALDIDAGLTDTDGSETLAIIISGVPVGATLSAGTLNPDGTWTLTALQLENLTITPAKDSDADFTLTVTATTTESDGSTATTTGTIDVTVAGVADAPTLDLNAGLTGDQDTGAAAGESGEPISLDIASAVTDPSETLSITITGVPAGATLSAGVEGPAGTWTLDPSASHLNNLTMTTALNFSGAVALAIVATSIDGSTQALASGTIDVTVTAPAGDTTADGVTLSSTGAAGLEDQFIDLNISADLIDTDGSESLSVTIFGVPAGAILSAGTFVTEADGTTTWTVDGADVASLQIKPEENSNVDFDLTMTATSTESDGNATTTTEPVSLHVDVTGVADAPTVSASIGNVLSDSYQDSVLAHEPIAFWQFNETSGTTVVDTSGNHTGEYHRGAESETDKHGIGAGAGDFDGKNDHIEIPHSSDMELSSGSITVWFNSDDVDDKQGLFSKDSSGFDNGGHLTAFVEDGEVRIRLQSGDDSYWVDGGALSDNSWSQITFNWGPGGMELYVDGQLVDTNAYTGGIENNTEPLVIGANSWSSDDGEANHLKNYFDGQIDEFSIMSNPLTAAEVEALYNTGGQDILDNGGTVTGTVVDTASYELQIAGFLADRDTSESLSIVVSGLPDGASLSAGIDNGNGTWTLLEADLSGLILTTDQTVIEDFDLTVTAVATEDDGDTATTATTVHVDVDGVEDSSVTLSGSSSDDILIGGDGDDFLKGRGGDDELYGGAGDDIMLGSSGNDYLEGGSGADTMFGSSGRDVLDGGAGDDYLDGGSGNDQLDGGAGDDLIKGGRGDDVITGGTGNDRLEGGEGADTFMFDTESGHDIITDILQQDVLMFEGQEFHMEDLVLSENSDGDVVVAFEGVDTSVTLEGVSINDLDANHDGDPSDGYTISDDGSGVTITIDSTG